MISELYNLKQQGIKICSNTIWDFDKCDNRFGFKYPGRIPGQIYANFYYYFSKKGDKILDLFSGSGTGIDVGLLMNRTAIGVDLNPTRNDILKFDLLKDPNPFENNFFQAIFCDPPYYNMNSNLYSNKNTDLANLNLDQFIQSLSIIVRKFYRSIKKNGYLAIIISNKKERGKLIDLELIINEIFSKYLELTHKIIIPYHQTKYQKLNIEYSFKNRKFLLIGHRTLFIFKK
ncbi:MAG: DNA methyltransferase [Promethearchaeota archaeon]